jgi:hypothetical protein
MSIRILPKISANNYCSRLLSPKCSVGISTNSLQKYSRCICRRKRRAISLAPHMAKLPATRPITLLDLASRLENAASASPTWHAVSTLGHLRLCLFVLRCVSPRSLIPIQPSVLNLAVYRPPQFLFKDTSPAWKVVLSKEKPTDGTDDPRDSFCA